MIVQKPYELPTTGPNTTVPSYQRPQNSSESATITMVQSIITENSTLKAQIQHLEAQLDKVRGLSNGLLSENKGLRQVYQERNRDISKLVKSISLQNQQNKSDIEHQSHLIQQLNYSTLKQIKMLDKQRREAQEKIEDKKKVILQISEIKNQLENEQLCKIRARINNGISSQAAATLKRKYEKELQANRNIEKEIDQLVIFSTKLRVGIRQLLRSNQPQRDILTMEKQELQQKLTHIKEETKRYREQLASDQLEFEKNEEDKRTKEERHMKILTGLNEEIKKYEFNQRCFNEANSQREKTKSRIVLSFANRANLTTALETVKDQKLQLLKKLQTRKSKLIEGAQVFQRREEALRQDNRENISRLANQISRNEANFEEERKKIVQQKLTVQDHINTLEHENGSLDDQIEEYSKLVNGHVNPIRQIEKIELTMRLRQIR